MRVTTTNSEEIIVAALYLYIMVGKILKVPLLLPSKLTRSHFFF